MSRVNITGVRDLLNSLAKTEHDMRKAQRSANLRAGDVVAKELKQQVPYGVDSVYRYQGEQHMKDAVVRSGNKKDKYTTENYVEVGFSKGTAWRAHFPLGTIKQPPNPYFDRTVKNTQSEVERVMTNEVRRVLR